MSKLKRQDLKPGVRYKAFSPLGVPIKGSYDLTPGCALTTAFTVEQMNPDEIVPEYAGETEMYWDSQESKQDARYETLYICEDGDEWPEDELEFQEIGQGEEDE